MRVVIADDTRLVLRVCSCLVTECQRAELVGTARNGAELLNVCRSACPDLVLVHVHMPVMNGLEAVASSKYPPAEPGALVCEPLKAAVRVANAARVSWAT
jgi:YesN/AraC family two-component response regulator